MTTLYNFHRRAIFFFIYLCSIIIIVIVIIIVVVVVVNFIFLFVCFEKVYIYNNNNFEGEEKLTNINNIKRTNEKREIERDREISRKLKFISTTIVILNFVKVFEKEKVKLN